MILGCLFGFRGYAQEASVKTHIDKNKLLIGQQINYQISVETDSTQQVQFPTGQTFSPLEMVWESKIDTFRLKEKYRLMKTYTLTQFDSGAYTIPAQSVFVGQKMFSTDSLRVQVQNVAIDTLKQPLFDIKPMLAVAPPRDKAWIWEIVLGVGLLIGVALFFLLWRRKRISEQEKIQQLPPFERAVWELNNLKHSKYLIEARHKQYYSELVDIVKSYLEKEVHISTSESTTDDLLEKLQLLQQQDLLTFNKATFERLKNVLQRSDLVKFAKSQPDDNTAESDRDIIENVVRETRQSILEKHPEVVSEHRPEKSRFRSWKIIVIGVLFLALSKVILGLLFGESSLKSLSESSWYTSDYGYPALRVSTPWVLKRKQLQTPLTQNEKIQSVQTFEAGSWEDKLRIVASIVTLKPFSEADSTAKALTEKLPFLLIQTELEQQKAQNIVTKEEEVKTAKGVKGSKIFGNFELAGSAQKFSYELYLFDVSGTLEQLLVIYDSKEDYGKEISQRIFDSIDFKTE